MTSLTSHLPLQNLNIHPKTSLHSHNTTQSFVAFSPTHHHPHITSQNLSPPNLQNTPKHNLSLSNPNLINYRTLSNAASPSYHITKSLTTQPAKLIDTQLYQNQKHTHHTNKLTPHLQTNHLPAHPTSPPLHQPPQTHNTHQNIFLSLSQHNSINYHSTQLHPQNHLIKQTPKNT